MAHRELPQEYLLAKVSDGEEARSVSLLKGESLAVIERSSGPVTLAAYGAPSHGHKILCDASALATILGVESEDAIPAALSLLFADVDGNKPLFLSDLMDMFDRAGQRYVYTAWTSQGDAVLRA